MLYSIKSTIDDTVLYSSNDIAEVRELQPSYKNSYIHYSQEAIDAINNDSAKVLEVAGEALLVINKDIFLVTDIDANIRALTLGAFDNEDI